MSRKAQYSFAKGTKFDTPKIQAKAQTIGEYLDSLGDDLTPEQVVADAKRQSSPLHEFFQWSDTEAARQYRLDQARYLLRAIKVRFVDLGSEAGREPVRKYVSLSPAAESGEERGKRYIPMVKVMSNATLRKQLLTQALEEARTWRKKYEDLRELAEVFEALDHVERRTKNRHAA